MRAAIAMGESEIDREREKDVQRNACSLKIAHNYANELQTDCFYRQAATATATAVAAAAVSAMAMAVQKPRLCVACNIVEWSTSAADSTPAWL